MSGGGDDVVSIDVHTHPALFQTYSRTTIDEHARAIESGKLGGAFLAAVGDGAALSTRNGTPYAARQPAPGVGADLAAATAARGRIAIMSVEGADHIKRMVDTVGVEHVAIGTDMAGVNPRSALFTDWAEWPSIPSALLDRGFVRQDVVRIMGGNVQRLLETTLG